MSLLTVAPAWADIGLSTRFVDIEVENVPLGSPTRVIHLKSRPYSVRNRSSAPINVQIQVGAPVKKYLNPGYEPIPDITWIQVIPDMLLVEPGQRAFAKVIIHVPDKPEYMNRHFQAKITATTVISKSVIAAAVESRLRFSTGPKPTVAEIEASKKKNAGFSAKSSPSKRKIRKSSR